MPPSQQGSRAGLITTLVISIILLMVSVITLIYNNSELTKAKADLTRQQGRYDKIVSNAALTGDEGVSQIDAVRDKLSNVGPTTIDVALEEIKRLTQAITGNASP